MATNSYERVNRIWYRVPINDFGKYYSNVTFNYHGKPGLSGKSLYNLQLKKGASHVLLEGVLPEHKDKYEMVDDWVWVDKNGKLIDKKLAEKLEALYNNTANQPLPEIYKDTNNGVLGGTDVIDKNDENYDEYRRLKNELDLENSNNSFDKALAQTYKDTGLVPDITKSATPMDNTIMTYNTPYGVKSVWIPTPELEMKIGQPKPPLKWYDYIPTAAMAIPSAVALWPAAKAAGTYALLHPVEMIGSTLSGYVGSKTVDLATSSASDGKYPTWGHFVTDNGRRAPVWLGEFSNPGAAVGGYAGFKWGLGAEKRLAETFMRTTENVNPLPTIKFNWSVMEPGHKKSIINYILFNAKDKTYPYNTFAFTKPRAYTGIFHGPKNLQGDVIDAFLYGKPLDSAIGTLKSKGSGFGPYELYIRNNYQNKAKDIPVYELNVPEGPLYVDDLVDGSIVVSNKHSITRPIELKHGDYDAAGHYIVEGVDLNNTTNKYLSEWDIWKFNSKDYLNRYNVADGNPIKKLGLKWGLDFIDSHGTPIIVRTPWSK